jgi:hypothetical protein
MRGEPENTKTMTNPISPCRIAGHLPGGNTLPIEPVALFGEKPRLAAAVREVVVNRGIPD